MPAVERAYDGPASLIDVIDRILDKGLVIDAFVRVSVVGLELLTIEARVVVASVDTYLRYAEAIGRIPMAARPRAEREDHPGLLGGGPNGHGAVGELLEGATAPVQGLLQGTSNQQQQSPQPLPQGQQRGQGNGQQSNGQQQQALAQQLRGLLDQLQTSGQPA